MTRPATIPDVLELTRRSKVVAEGRLAEFVDFLEQSVTDVDANSTAAVLERMVERGLLTQYQANELAAGRCDFWIGGYQILDLLGRGGMGHVYLAEHPLLKKRMALKVLKNCEYTDDGAKDRFQKEARAAAVLDHPNIVRVFALNIAHNPPFLVMEYVDGVSLQAAVARYGTFTPGEAAAVGVEVAMGLQQAFEVGLVHRDIKPANVLIDRKGGIKILDLGIARFVGDPISRLSDSETVIGTLDYLAPEQAIDSCKIDSRADQYALGATLFFLLAGHPPFADDEVNRKLVRKQQSNAPSIAAMRLDIPTGLAQVINRMLERSASDRYATPRDVAEALKPWAELSAAAFPNRLFLPWRSRGDGVEQSPMADADPSPTPLPPTRRILRSSTERRVAPTESMTDTTPMPVAALKEIPPAEEPIRPEEWVLDESGSPTVTLLPAPPRRWWSNLGRRFWRVIGIIAGASLATALLAHWLG
jgi:serine/threonine-protein kinase